MSAASEERAILAEHELRGKQAQFVLEYLVDFNGKQAAIRAKYSPHTAENIASENLRKPQVAAAIAAIQTKRAERLICSAEKIEKRLWDIARADPRDIVQTKRVCCRFCYGRDGLYQETPAERHARWEKHQHLLRVAKDMRMVPPFDELGGVGYDKRKAINPDCVQCFGDGDLDPVIADTRHLTEEAVGLYAGFEITAGGGLKVKMHDPIKAMDMLGRRFGMWKDKGDDDGTDRVIRHVNDPEA